MAGQGSVGRDACPRCSGRVPARPLGLLSCVRCSSTSIIYWLSAAALIVSVYNYKHRDDAENAPPRPMLAVRPLRSVEAQMQLNGRAYIAQCMAAGAAVTFSADGHPKACIPAGKHLQKPE